MRIIILIILGSDILKIYFYYFIKDVIKFCFVSNFYFTVLKENLHKI